ncbi:MAG: histidine ammonia-lyase [Anaerolineaceae bacterium]|nr:histidine ammonia-lyase [Anaerolineaceae bacterium]
MMDQIVLDGSSLSCEDVLSCAYNNDTEVVLSEEAIIKIKRASEAVAGFVRDGEVVYGITTGFGAFKDRIIPKEKVELLQHNILVSHAVGVGSPLNIPTTRAMMLIRANTLSKGHSGIKLETLELLLKMLNYGIHPVIPEIGSLGASGDLAPLAHMSLPLIGHGEVFYKGEQMLTSKAFEFKGLKPLRLAAKEGLALTNGTTFMTALGLLAVKQAENLIKIADIASAMTLEALNGTPKAFDPRIHELRPHEGQIKTAKIIRELINGSQMLRADDSLNVQDAYTLRCIPQVHGAIRDTIQYCKNVLEKELNSVTDNPLIFFDENGNPEIISGGNFHGEPLAFAMDFLAIALTDLGNISERRIAKLVDETNNQHLLPAFLTNDGGLNSGFMLLQYTAAALASENKVLSHPSSTDSIPSSANVEDHVSMGANAARHTRDIVKNLETIISIELMSAAQAIDFRLRKSTELRLGIGTDLAYKTIREYIPFIEKDRILYTQIQKMQEILRNGILLEKVNKFF